MRKNNGTISEFDSSEIYGSLKQKFAKLLHRTKALYRPKMRKIFQNLSHFIKDNSTVIDVGAHMGYFSKEFARLYNQNCRIYSFEPMQYNYSILERVCGKYSNVTLENLALADRESTETIYVPIKESGKIGPGLAHMGAEADQDFISESIQTVRFDDYVKQHDIQNISLIKIDVEGAEYVAFLGMLETLKRDKPVIYSEIHEPFLQRMNTSANELFALLRSIGYSASIYDAETGIRQPVDNYTVNADYLFEATERTHRAT